jgi:hypothetical protein
MSPHAGLRRRKENRHRPIQTDTVPIERGTSQKKAARIPIRSVCPSARAGAGTRRTDTGPIETDTVRIERSTPRKKAARIPIRRVCPPAGAGARANRTDPGPIQTDTVRIERSTRRKKQRASRSARCVPPRAPVHARAEPTRPARNRHVFDRGSIFPEKIEVVSATNPALPDPKCVGADRNRARSDQNRLLADSGSTRCAVDTVHYRRGACLRGSGTTRSRCGSVRRRWEATRVRRFGKHRAGLARPCNLAFSLVISPCTGAFRPPLGKLPLGAGVRGRGGAVPST